MSPFLSGVLGAASLLLVLGAVRRLAFRRLRHGRGGRFMLRRLFGRLGTRPEQESVISGEVEAFWRDLSELRGDGPALRNELAELLAAEVVDETTVSAVLGRRMEKLEALRTRAAASFARIHDALDAGQRQKAVAILRSGPFGHGHRHAHGRC
jgi:hypothetical protein